MTELEQRKIFSENLRRIMQAQGLTQADLAGRFNIAKSTASSWYNGGKMPRMWKTDEIAEWLGVERSELLNKFEANAIMKEMSARVSEDGLAEINEIFLQLSPDNRAKLIELSRLYLDAQNKNAETK